MKFKNGIRPTVKLLLVGCSLSLILSSLFLLVGVLSDEIYFLIFYGLITLPIFTVAFYRLFERQFMAVILAIVFASIWVFPTLFILWILYITIFNTY